MALQSLAKSYIDELNLLGKAGMPFLFAIDYEMQKPLVYPLHDLPGKGIHYHIDDGLVGFRNFEAKEVEKLNSLVLKKKAISFQQYEQAFDIVKKHLSFGNSFLCNLTAETAIESNWSLDELFYASKAKYKFYLEDKFLSFSPESFVKINQNGILSSFPMKGTIEANVKNAEAVILGSEKEQYEHNTIVDLIRNDISMVADKVWVDRFRYIDTIRRESGSDLLQVSSEIKGQLSVNWKEYIGDIFHVLLPAGSITGAPKEKTVEIISEAEKLTYENTKRGYYTGVFGVFDGDALSSAVMIRCIEQRNKQLYFKSGGGITYRSDARQEYEELLSKIYVPLHRVH